MGLRILQVGLLDQRSCLFDAALYQVGFDFGLLAYE
jgi:hypothetical protein